MPAQSLQEGGKAQAGSVVLCNFIFLFFSLKRHNGRLKSISLHCNMNLMI